MSLSKFYSAEEYGDLLSKQIDYTPPMAIKILGHGPEGGVELGPCDLNGDYWAPSEELKPHMRWMVKTHAARKLRVADGNSINRNFSRFPCGYENFSIVKEVKVDGRNEARVCRLSDLMIDDTVRLGRLSPDGAVVLQKANYLDQLASNITCKERFVREMGDGRAEPYVPFAARPDALTFRHLDVDPETGQLRPLTVCHQANTVGVGVLFLDHDGVPLLRPRGLNNEEQAGNLAVMEKGLHWSSSGAMQWDDIPPDLGSRVTGFSEAMHREIREETSMPREDYTLMPLCFAREFARGGKPQFYFVAGFKKELRLADGSLAAYVRALEPARDRWEVSPALESDRGLWKQAIQFFSRKSGKVECWYLSEKLRIDRLNLLAPQELPLWTEMTYECKAALYFSTLFKAADLLKNALTRGG